jgi:rhodanese-related sulfurtransferase/TusA-related sulfurtransferase
LIHVNHILDAKGLFCPMPIVKTKKTMDELLPGQVLEVQATDKGSIVDIQSWATKTGHTYLGNQIHDEVIHHYLQKAHPSDVKPEQKHPISITNDEFRAKLEQTKDDLLIIDVREPAEFAFGHIPGALSLPLGILEERINTLDPAKNIYVICRTSNRSDMAAHMLSTKGFARVTIIIPGMSEWTGPVTK